MQHSRRMTSSRLSAVRTGDVSKSARGTATRRRFQRLPVLGACNAISFAQSRGFILIEHPRIDVRPMHRGVAPRAPASAPLQQQCVADFADVNLTGRHPGALNLGMTSKAKVRVALDQEFAIDGAVRAVTHRAAFAHRLVLEDKRSRLIPVALSATFVQPCHGHAARGFVNVSPMRIMALNAIHASFHHGVPLRQVELSLSAKMTLKTCGRVFAWIKDEFPPPAAALNMFAARPVARFAPALTESTAIFKVNPRVGAARKYTRDLRVAV